MSAIDQACIALWRDTAEFHQAGMSRALAAAYEADADNITHTGTYAPAIVEAWLRNRVKELRGEL